MNKGTVINNFLLTLVILILIASTAFALKMGAKAETVVEVTAPIGAQSGRFQHQAEIMTGGLSRIQAICDILTSTLIYRDYAGMALVPNGCHRNESELKAGRFILETTQRNHPPGDETDFGNYTIQVVCDSLKGTLIYRDGRGLAIILNGCQKTSH